MHCVFIDNIFVFLIDSKCNSTEIGILFDENDYFDYRLNKEFYLVVKYIPIPRQSQKFSNDPNTLIVCLHT